MSRAKANAVAGGVGLLVAVSLLVVLGLVSGCATRPAAAYQKPGVAEAERERDENACLRASVASDDRATSCSRSTLIMTPITAACRRAVT